jgi:pSer/pThr/pTyr-binding forkhead associated (FHA) protein
VLLRFDDGGVITAGPAMFIGRDPIAPPGEAPAMLVPVADPDRSVSKTHLTVRAHPDGVVVTDRGSVNGTVVQSPSGEVTSLVPGEGALVPLGSTVRFGSRSFVVSGGVA